MAASHHDFTDSESAAFLYSEDNKPEERASIHREGLWTRTARYVPYILLAVGIFLALLIGISTPSDKKKVDADVTSILPSQAMFGKIPTKKVVFEPDASYDVDPFGPDEIDSPWYKLAPSGKGHIKVDNPGAWGLGGGFPLSEDLSMPTSEEYTIALYHQLHCLAAIKSKMSRLQHWYANDSDNEYLQFALGDDQVADHHIYHCFDYLRQALLCHGDTTLEGARRVRDPKTGHETTVRGVDGWGVTHACRDPASIWAFAEEHRSRKDTGID